MATMFWGYLCMQNKNQDSIVQVNLISENPKTYLDFQRMFPDEMSCIMYFENMRWPKGFVCERCLVNSDPYRFTARPKVLKCRSCLQDTSITAGTVMHRSKTSIHIWFWAAYLISAQTPGVSALELQKRLGIKRYETAFQLLHKLRAIMVRPDRDKIGEEWPLELDIVFIGGKTKSGIQGKTDQIPVIISVEIRKKESRCLKTNKLIWRAQAGRTRIQTLPDKSSSSVDAFVKECIYPGAVISSDGGTEFTNLRSLGFDHRPEAMLGNKDKMDSYLPMISRVTANLKTWIDGIFHGVGKHHMQTYLNEFMFRFNRRFYRDVSFRNLLGLGTQHSGVSYKEIYGDK